VKIQLWMIVGQAASILSANCPALAQVVSDQTLPVGERSQISGDPNFQIDGGAIRGSNLFHSFQTFSVPTGSSVIFNNGLAIANIISRVTGSSASNIDGLIRANGTTNLFLINPNGILFGNNARLEIGGSFSASTADSVKFADGFEFSAIAPQPLLTISAPIGFQYGSNPGEIRSQGAELQVLEGQRLTLAGGAIAIDGGKLFAPGGRVELVGRDDVAIGNDAEVNVRSGGGGGIAIAARNLTVTGVETRVRAGIAANLGTVGAQAGNIDINVTETVKLDATGKLDGAVIDNTVARTAIGNAGDVNITASALIFTNGALVDATTYGRGNAGNITIVAKDGVSFDRVDGYDYGSGVYSWVNIGAIGQGGNISITTDSLSLTNGAQVSTSVYGQGNAGNINIVARKTVLFDGENSVGYTSGAYSSVELAGIGQGGDVNITTGSLLFTKGGLVNSALFGRGDAGNINIIADTMSFDGLSSLGFGSGPNSSVQIKGVGQGGTITIRAGQLSITNGGQVSASSEGQGNAGNLEVNAQQLRLDQQGSIVAETRSGRGGNITLQVQDFLLLRRGSFISTTAGTAQAGGDGGNIAIEAKSIIAVPKEDSNLTANAFSGRGGNVRITTQGIFGIEPRSRTTPFSDITASSDFGISGTILLNSPDIDPSRGTATLPTGLVDTNSLIANSCVARRNRQGRFIITGTGGLATQPDDLANAAFPTYELIPEVQQVSVPAESDRIYQLATGEIILGRSCR
jgi:filamentous hemagglutinin family protein